jgi:hexokinase
MDRRVCEVVLNGDKTFNLVQQKYRVSETLKSGEATALFGSYEYFFPFSLG